MKAYKRTQKLNPEVSNKGKRKKIDKPWLLQYKWKSEEMYKKHSWLNKKYPGDVWIKDFDKYIDLEHALQQMSKKNNNWFDKMLFVTKDWRIVHKETGVCVNIFKTDLKK